MAIRVAVAGATGWAGAAVARSILASNDLQLVGAVSRKHAGSDIGPTLDLKPTGVIIRASVDEALQEPTDVLVDYTHPLTVKDHTLSALNHGVHVVVGTSGLNGVDYEDIARLAVDKSKGVVAAGNFSLTAALAKHFSLIASQYLSSWEIIEYADIAKVDAPSGTVQELAESMGEIRQPKTGIPMDQILGSPAARGATIAGVQVHAIRLPSYTLGFEVIFGMPNERLLIRHDAGRDPQPYVSGTLLAVRRVTQLVGLIRGLDHLLFPNEAQ